MIRRKVFISGPMAGYKNLNKDEFDKAEKWLTKAGFSVFNPASLNLDESWETRNIALIDISALSSCDLIYQLDEWEDSKGARAEYSCAVWMGLTIINKRWLRRNYPEVFESNKIAEEEYKEYLEGGPKPRTEHRFW